MCGQDGSRHDPLAFGCVGHPFGYELRQRRFVDVLQLATAAALEVTAGRHGTVRTMDQRAIGLQDITWHTAGRMATVRSHTIAPRGDADNFIWIAHRNVA